VLHRKHQFKLGTPGRSAYLMGKDIKPNIGYWTFLIIVVCEMNLSISLEGIKILTVN
jgi:hypothetical protein